MINDNASRCQQIKAETRQQSLETIAWTMRHRHIIVRPLSLRISPWFHAATVTPHPSQTAQLIRKALIRASIPPVLERHPPARILARVRPTQGRRSGHSTRKQAAHVHMVDGNIDRGRRFSRRSWVSRERDWRWRRRSVQVLQLWEDRWWWGRRDQLDLYSGGSSLQSVLDGLLDADGDVRRGTGDIPAGAGASMAHVPAAATGAAAWNMGVKSRMHGDIRWA